MAQIAQVALCAADLPRTIRTFTDTLGFLDAGGRARWGEVPAQIQELPTGEDTYAMMWWLVGRQEFVQIELFQHTSPAQRPRRPGWRPCDLGWTRFGIVVADFAMTMNRLHKAGLATMTDPFGAPGSRRVCLREPGTDSIIEVLERAPEVRGPVHRHSDGGLAPALAYVAASVTDLDAVRRTFIDAFGMAEIQADSIHSTEHESLWGLAGADRECAVFALGDVLIEVVQYDSPTPRPPASDALLSDQGIMNIAIGYRDRNEFLRALDRAATLGASATSEPSSSTGSVYLRIADRLSIELLQVPAEYDGMYGFLPRELPSDGVREAVSELHSRQV